MPHGTRDWGHVGPRTTTFGLDDWGEVAVRLGSPVLYDRRGDVVWMTDFREGISELLPSNFGVGSGVSLWTGAQRQGAFCVALICGAALDDYGQVQKYVPYPVTSGIGVEVSFSVAQHTWSVEMGFFWLDGTRERQAAVRVRPTANVLEYYDGTLGWTQEAAGLDLRELDYAQHTMKLVANTVDNRYVRVLLNQNEHPLAPHPVVDVGAATTIDLMMYVLHVGDGGGADECFIDNMIITQNEL